MKTKLSILLLYLSFNLSSCYLLTQKKDIEPTTVSSIAYYSALKNKERLAPFYNALIEIFLSCEKLKVSNRIDNIENSNKIFTIIEENIKNFEVIEKGVKNLDALFSLDTRGRDDYGEIFYLSLKPGLLIDEQELVKEYNEFKNFYSKIDSYLFLVSYFKVFLNYTEGKNLQEKRLNLEKNISKFKDFYNQILKEKKEKFPSLIRNMMELAPVYDKIKILEDKSLYEKIRKDSLKMNVLLIKLINSHKILFDSILADKFLTQFFKIFSEELLKKN